MFSSLWLSYGSSGNSSSDVVVNKVCQKDTFRHYVSVVVVPVSKSIVVTHS
jgi:hypothetical protein